MSMYPGPRRRPSRAVYRRRRLAVLVIALVIVVVFVVVVARWAGGTKGTPSAVPSPTSSRAAVSPSPTPSATPVASGSTPLCESTDVSVAAVTNASSYSAGQFPQLSLSVTNNGSSPCRINVGTAEQVFTITSGSGSQVFWKSTDCQTKATSSVIALDPGKTLSSGAPITWDREASDPATCGGSRAQVPAGGTTYALQTSVDGIVSNAVKFTLN